MTTTAAASQHYLETCLRLPDDPLVTLSRLAAAGVHRDYAIYENDGQWSYAGGALAEISLDRSGARLRGAESAELTELAWDGAPLRQVHKLLERVPFADWRAYGWAAFELAYAKGGDTSLVGGERLLHLVVPHTEVRIKGGWVQLRSADATTLKAAAAALSTDGAQVADTVRPVDVRGHGADAYERAVELAIADIRQRKLQKVILSRVVELREEIDFIGTYVAGRRGNNPARSFLLRLGGVEAVGFSPEIVVKVDSDGRVVSQPLAGTRALTDDPELNERLRSDLVTDAKEIFEHAISVKIALDDIESICAPGSVAVEEYMAVRHRGSVQHLASRVSGRLAEGYGPWDVFAAAFPAVTASGVPKEAAYASIRTHEPQARGLYSGAVLTVDQDGAMDAALVLRAVYRRDGRTWLQAGAGVVGQSRPAREFEETCEKLESVARFLVPSTRLEGAAHA
ncbi:salicylate synthase [Streptomyces sp. MZ04]|uniref:salicylate synthase n=1 Tax=Streptomyces sp. MZ04 TaxID=2559236 RepID=UPI00107E7851|nr:salicylate synthase [Streptomyces sp. MZ04]TGB15114.1 salicylate synthase [Streptomyces sp. MZ04]